MVRDATIEFRRSVYQDATAIIRREYAAELRLDDVARRILTSPRQLQRAFDEIARTSFRDYLHHVRMEKAAEALRTHPESTIPEIAHSVGYSQRAQFAKAFRREYGMAPNEYRRALGRSVPLTPPVDAPDPPPAAMTRARPDGHGGRRSGVSVRVLARPGAYSDAQQQASRAPLNSS